MPATPSKYLPSRLAIASPPNTQVKVKIIIQNFYCVFGGDVRRNRGGRRAEILRSVLWISLWRNTADNGYNIHRSALYRSTGDDWTWASITTTRASTPPSWDASSDADTIVPDPANPQDLNRFSYVRNSPLMYTDPSGNKPCGDGEKYNCDGQLDTTTPPVVTKPPVVTGPKPKADKDKDRNPNGVGYPPSSGPTVLHLIIPTNVGWNVQGNGSLGLPAGFDVGIEVNCRPNLLPMV